MNTTRLPTEKLLAILEVSNLVSMSLSLEEIMQKSVDLIVSRLGYNSAVIYMNYPALKKIVSKTFTNTYMNKVLTKMLNTSFDKLYITYDSDDNYIVKTVLNKEILEDTDLSKFVVPVVSKEVAKVLQGVARARKIVSLPIIYREDCLGAIMFTRTTSDSFQPDIDILKVYTQQISTAINNSSLFEQKIQQIGELERKNKELTSINNLVTQITKTLDPNIVAQSAVDALPQDDNMIGAVLASVSKDLPDRLYIRAFTRNQISYQAEKILGGSVGHFYTDLADKSHSHTMPYKAMKMQEIQFSNKLSDFLSPPVPRALVGPLGRILQIKSILTYPVFSRGNVVGTLTYLLRKKGYEDFDDNDKQLFQTYTNQVSIALDNSTLFTESEKAKKSLADALEELEERRKFEQDMVDVMGHELRTPMSILRNAVGMMELDLKNKGEIPLDHQKKYVDVALEAARREIRLIETLLSATKTDSKGFQLLLQQVDLHKVIENALLANQGEAKKKGIEIVYSPPKENIQVYGDQIRVQEIADNFINNAVKYTNKGNVEIKIYSEENLGWIEVKDSGIGISEEDLKKIGNKFFRAVKLNEATETPNDKTGNIKPSGTGLGLYVSFNLVKLMEGKYSIKSKAGEGSIFKFGIPIFKGQGLQQVQKKTDNIFNQ